MANMVMISGVPEIKAAMKIANKKLGHSSSRGLLKAGRFLQRESQKIVPVDTANLKGSAGTQLIGSGWYADAVVFYTASYAIYVHERTDLSHKAGKTAKFLERPAREKRAQILAIIRGEIISQMNGTSVTGGGGGATGPGSSSGSTGRRWANQHGSGIIGG